MAGSYACISLAGPRAHQPARSISAGDPGGQLALASITIMPACGPTLNLSLRGGSSEALIRGSYSLGTNSGSFLVSGYLGLTLTAVPAG